ncbi:MAG: hypothetical protein Aureis2KO_30670 [Aureisphaera sp.]
MQICEQINEKKNGFGIDFLVFFSHTKLKSWEQKTSPFLAKIFVKKNTTKLRVRYGETDQMGVVYYGNYAQFLEQGRTEWLRELGFSYKWMEENNVQLPVTHLSIDFKFPARYDDLIYVTTTLRKIPTFKIEFDYEIHNEEGRLLVSASTTLCFINSDTKKLMKAPHYLLEKLSG